MKEFADKYLKFRRALWEAKTNEEKLTRELLVELVKGKQYHFLTVNWRAILREYSSK